MTKKIITLALLCFFLPAVSLAATQSTAKKAVSLAGVKKVKVIKKFADLNKLKDFLSELPDNNYGPRMYKMMDSVAEALPAPSAAGAAGLASADYSATNVQVAGVDESDIVKTDGEYIYSVSKNNLQIIKAYPGESAKVVTTIQFKDNPQDIYLNGNRLIVFGSDYNLMSQPMAKTFIRRSGYTFVKIFDIGDKTSPKLVKDLSFEGYYADSRLRNGYLYFLTNYSEGNWLADGVLPKMIEGGKVVGYGDRFPNVYYFDTIYNTVNYVVLAAINVQDTAKPVKREVYLMPGVQTMYASPDNIYLSYTKYFNEQDLIIDVTRQVLSPLLSEGQKIKIAKIEAADKAVLSDDEKHQKINQVLQGFLLSQDQSTNENLNKLIQAAAKIKFKSLAEELEKTVIHKISYNADSFNYIGSAEVRGTLLNQFSMDEAGGYLRVATTKNRSWSGFAEEADNAPYSNVYVIDKNLNPVGALEKLAVGERIYAARFVGGRVYLVTFEQTDPLFVISLLNPAYPYVLGELKMPGFSNYLHPYDENTLIGVGRNADTNDQGRAVVKGLKVSLFDVANVASPKEVAKVELGGRGSDSPALYDHKAFLLAPGKNLLAIPVYLTKVGGSWGDYDSSGAAVFAITKDSLQIRQVISHQRPGDKPDSPWTGGDFYGSTVKRSLYINENLYTVSDNYVKINKLSDLSVVNTVDLNLTKEDFRIINRAR